jgi:hypothetical protein
MRIVYSLASADVRDVCVLIDDSSNDGFTALFRLLSSYVTMLYGRAVNRYVAANHMI